MADELGAYGEALEALRSGDRDRAVAIVTALPPDQRVRLTLRAYNEREFELNTLLRAEDSVHDMRRTGLPGMGVYEGIDGYMQMIEAWLDSFPEATIDVTDVDARERPDGTRCIQFIATQTMAGGESGVPVEFVFAGLVIAREDGYTTWSMFDRDLERARAEFETIAAGADPSS